MTREHDDIQTPQLPLGVSEADVAEVISPPRLMTAERRAELARIEAKLMADGRWSGLIAELQAQAGVLSRPVDVVLPAGIARGVESRLNELALQELIASEQAADTIPVSRVTFSNGRSWLDAWRSTPARGLAVAAAVLLAVGAGWLLVDSVRKSWPGLPKTVVARSDGDGAGASAPAGTNPANDERAIEVAGTDTENLVDPSALHTVLAKSDMPPVAEAITPERALALAAEGRLAVRVRTLRPDHVEHQLNRLARDPSGPWKRIREDAPLGTAYASLWTSRPLEMPGRDGPSGPSPTVIAGSGAGEQDRGSGVDATPGPSISPLVQSITVDSLYEVRVAETPQDIEALRAKVLERWNAAKGSNEEAGLVGFVCGVEFAELDVPARMEAPTMDPRDVLWWTTPGERWLKQVRVPVVIETVR